MKNIFKKIVKNRVKQRKRGETYIDTIIKIIACVVVGALILSSVYLLIDSALKKTTEKINGLFDKSNINFNNENTLSDETNETVFQKGNIIILNLDGENRRYRILNTEGTNVEILTMFDVSDSQMFNNGELDNIYEESDLDIYLNETWYNSLTVEAKNAIIEKTFSQDSWYMNANGSPVYYGYGGKVKPGTINYIANTYTVSLADSNYSQTITRKVYTLSLQNIFDYVLDSTITDGQLQNYNIWRLLWDDESTHDGQYIWLRSASATYLNTAWAVYGASGILSDGYGINNSITVRAVLTIDLSMINYEIPYSSVPVITIQPLSATYVIGETSTKLFADADAVNKGFIKQQWQISTDGETFNNINGAEYNYCRPDTSSIGTYVYRCKFTNELNGTIETAYSDESFIIVSNTDNLPVKGQLITMNLDGIERTYKILNINGTVVEVLGMFNPNLSLKFSSINSFYSGSDIDVALNTTWYNTLTSTAKSAIVPKLITQYQYEYNIAVYDIIYHASCADYSTKAVKEVVGERYVYTLGIEDIEEYYDNIYDLSDIYMLYYNTYIKPSEYLCYHRWLSSADSGHTIRSWRMNEVIGRIENVFINFYASPGVVFNIDLNKIIWNYGLVEPQSPVITEHPISTTYSVGDVPIMLTVMANSIDGGLIESQWQISVDEGITYIDITDVLYRHEYYIKPNTTCSGTYLYRCKFINILNGMKSITYSNVATIIIE